MTRRILIALFALAMIHAAGALVHADSRAEEAAFGRFWAASSPVEARRLIRDVLDTGVGFDAAYRRLQQGRSYGPARTGVFQLVDKTADGVEHTVTVAVPASYDPARRYQLRFQLHGGVMMRHDTRPRPARGGALEGADPDAEIVVWPYAWAEEPWWSDDQVLNLEAILDTLKRRYNVDENHVVVSGVSDGGTGTYYVAMRETTPFAAFLPLNGFWVVLNASDIDDGAIFPDNLRNKPLFIVNGGRDPLYPARMVEPHIAHMKAGGVPLEFHLEAEAAHDTSWWPRLKGAFAGFVRSHPRAPLPDALTWETSGALTHNRAHWLVIDKLGAAPGEAASLPDLNRVDAPPQKDFGALSAGAHIVRVTPGSNADRIGLRLADVLVKVNGRAVTEDESVDAALEPVAPGARLDLVVSRNSAPVELSGVYEPQMVAPPPQRLFARRGPTGRVDVTRDGNTIRAATRGVAAFTLLLSPDQFDFAKPVTVMANGRTVFSGTVRKDVGTLLKWAADDNDRTMLFGAELHIDLTR